MNSYHRVSVLVLNELGAALLVCDHLMFCKSMSKVLRGTRALGDRPSGIAHFCKV